MLGKEHWLKQLKWTTNTRNYIVIPCGILSTVATLYCVAHHNQSGAQFNLMFTAYNAIVYVFNVHLCGKYNKLISLYEKLETHNE